MKALQKDPTQRYQTGKELAAALKKCLGAGEPVFETHLPVREKKNHLGALFAVVALLAAISGGLFFWITKKAHAPQKSIASQGNISPASIPNPAPVVQKAKEIAAVKEINMPLATADQPEAKVTVVRKPDPKPFAREQKAATHTVRIDKPASKHLRETVPAANTPQAVESKGGAIKTSLKVRTSPQGASVHIDGKPKGTTPLTLILPVGKHHLRIVLAGYQELERDITVDELMEYPLAYNLKAID